MKEAKGEYEKMIRTIQGRIKKDHVGSVGEAEDDGEDDESVKVSSRRPKQHPKLRLLDDEATLTSFYEAELNRRATQSKPE